MTALQDPNGACDLLILRLPGVLGEGEGLTAAQDVRTYTGVATAIMAAFAGVAGTLTVKLQDSADGSTGWADVPGGAFPVMTSGAEIRRLPFNIGATRGFIRANLVLVGAGASYNVSISCLAKRT
jgi:hypothetical protein